MAPTEHLLEAQREALGDRLLAVYLFGSATTGSFQPGISDGDTVAVLATDPSDSDVVMLGGIHSRLVEDAPEWNERVEVDYDVNAEYHQRRLRINEAWTRLEQRVNELKDELAAAVSPDDLQDVGRRAREVLIELGQLALSDEALGPEIAAPKQADAKQRLSLFLEARAPGAAHAELRQLVRAAWELAQKVTQSQSIERVDALAAAQATVLLVRIIQDLAQ